MKNVVISFLVVLLSVGFFAEDAEARRLGGGKSFGMSRNVMPSQSMAPSRSVSPPPAPSAQPAPASGMSRWLGPLAGLAAGIGLASLMSHLGMGEGFANVLMIGLLVFAAIFLFRLLARKSQPANSMAYAGAQNVGSDTPPRMSNEGSSASESPAAPALPAGFDGEGFLRQAKLNFVRLQAANDAGNMDDIKEFSTPELFAEVQLQYQERGRATQQTDVVQLDASLLEVVTEDRRHVASVRFFGALREDAGAAPQSFDEVWHLTKPTDGSRGWVVAGIQQIA